MSTNSKLVVRGFEYTHAENKVQVSLRLSSGSSRWNMTTGNAARILQLDFLKGIQHVELDLTETANNHNDEDSLSEKQLRKALIELIELIVRYNRNCTVDATNCESLKTPSYELLRIFLLGEFGISS